MNAAKLIVYAEDIEAKHADPDASAGSDDEGQEGDMQRKAPKPFTKRKPPPHRVHEDAGVYAHVCWLTTR